MKRITGIIRIAFTIYFVYNIYHEAGTYTGIFAGLVGLYIELNDYVMEKQRLLISEIIKYLKL